MRRLVITCAVIACVSVPVGAELKYTSKMTVKTVEGAAPATDMIGAMLGPMILQMLGGAEGVEMHVTMHDDGRMRTDYPKSFAGMPAGTVVVMRTDGSSVGFDSAAKTWWKIDTGVADPRMADMMAQMTPEVSTSRTGEFATVAGLRAERVKIAMTMPIPLPEGLDEMPPQMLAMIPKEVRVDGDTWVSTEYAQYAKGFAKLLSTGPMASFGLDKMMGGLAGFSVRQVMRISLLAGYEMETLVSELVEQDVPDSVFDVPTGFKEIPMPTPNIR